jgi:hypothetical protein
VWRLAKKAEKTERTLRVALLACSKPLPADIDGRARREHITPVDRDVIEDFFEQFAAHTSLEPTPGAIHTATDEVLEKAPPPDDPDWLLAVSVLAAAGAEKMYQLAQRS